MTEAAEEHDPGGARSIDEGLGRLGVAGCAQRHRRRSGKQAYAGSRACKPQVEKIYGAREARRRRDQSEPPLLPTQPGWRFRGEPHQEPSSDAAAPIEGGTAEDEGLRQHPQGEGILSCFRAYD